MKSTISTLALIAGITLAGTALAQDPPSGGPDAKGNAPIKHVHTVNDGTAKKGANSFTQNEARKHILNSGYTDVSGLTKGKDGVWRGTAMKGGASLNVALDFKGNVSEGGPTDSPAAVTSVQTTTSTSATKPPAPVLGTGAPPTARAAVVHHHGMRHRHHHHWRHHYAKASCANPGPNGVACSGRDRNHNGISDREDRALKAGTKP